MEQPEVAYVYMPFREHVGWHVVVPSSFHLFTIDEQDEELYAWDKDGVYRYRNGKWVPVE